MFKKLYKKMKIVSLITALVLVVASLPVFSVSAAPALDPSIDQFNVVGAVERYTVSGYTGTVNWVLLQVVGSSQIVGVSPGGTINAPTQATTIGSLNYIDVQAGQVAEATVQATLSDGTVLVAEKKWGEIDTTQISAPQTVPMIWNEPEKTWTGTAIVSDKIIATFKDKDNITYTAPAAGAILNWYLVQASAAVPMVNPAFPFPQNSWESNLLPLIAALPRANYAQFTTGTGAPATYVTTTSDNSGMSSVTITTHAEEAVKVVVVAVSPNHPNVVVFPEITTVNFWTREWEKVPQVAWAGDKVVLEKNFGVPGAIVRFALENQSPGTIEPFEVGPAGFLSDAQTVWAIANRLGVASCIVHSEDPGEVDVLASMWVPETSEPPTPPTAGPDNQHAFLVYFLKFEDITLANVSGKRAGHNNGLWTPPNPCDPATDVLQASINVSQDELMRARVRGWFTNAEASTRDEREIGNVVLPEGRWILPDDWALLAGPTDWQARRIHWDIMDAPCDGVTSYPAAPTAGAPTGPYNSDDGKTVGPENLLVTPKEYGVTGPFSPGLEMMTPTGYDVDSYGYPTPSDPLRLMKTVVPNGALDRWDAPMPPAKIIFEILAGPGFFKGAMKQDIYYINSSNGIQYTNPFYQVMIPAHEAIPAFINNGGYDWSSFGNPAPAQGPYKFWTIINQPSYLAPVESYGPILPSKTSSGAIIPGSGRYNPDWAGHPTRVEAYSDNHGEAMVYLNGYWNMDLSAFITNGAYDVPQGTAIGTTTVVAFADYPYLRKFEPVESNTVAKTWLWGKQIRGTDPAPYPNGTTDPANVKMVLQTGTLTNLQGTPPFQTAMSDKKMAWVWITNPDGFAAVGEKIDWTVEQASGSGINIPDVTGMGISNYNDITKSIGVQHGFLDNTGGYTLNVERTVGRSWTRLPTPPEKALFLKFWPTLDPNAYAVAAVEITSSLPSLVNLQISIDEGILGTIRRETHLDFSAADPADDFVLGDANQDGAVNMADVIMVERMILGLAPATTEITNRHPGQAPNMGDVIFIERLILGK